MKFQEDSFIPQLPFIARISFSSKIVPGILRTCMVHLVCSYRGLVKAFRSGNALLHLEPHNIHEILRNTRKSHTHSCEIPFSRYLNEVPKKIRRSSHEPLCIPV